MLVSRSLTLSVLFYIELYFCSCVTETDLLYCIKFSDLIITIFSIHIPFLHIDNKLNKTQFLSKRLFSEY